MRETGTICENFDAYATLRSENSLVEKITNAFRQDRQEQGLLQAFPNQVQT